MQAWLLCRLLTRLKAPVTILPSRVWYAGGIALPVYLQRHWLWIMAAGQAGAGPYVDGTPLLATLARDTVTVNSNSYLVVRYIAEVSAQGTSPDAPTIPSSHKARLCRWVSAAQLGNT